MRRIAWIMHKSRLWRKVESLGKRNLGGVLFYIAAILFFIAAAISKDYLYISLGFLFAVLGISRRRKDK